MDGIFDLLEKEYKALCDVCGKKLAKLEEVW